MNCLEFRHEQLTEPRRRSATALAHLRGCRSCEAFARGADESECVLLQALEIPIPEGLADRIILASRDQNRTRWHAWALAASVFIAVALAVSASVPWHAERASERYARLAIVHVVHEPESLTTLLDATAEAIQVAVDDFGGTLKESLGHVRYVRQCPVEDVTAWHIVFETSEGLATLILVPGKQLDRVQSASLEGWSALARPTPRGYYVVVTASSQMTSRIDRIVQARVDFGT